MKIVVDENMPFVTELLSSLAANVVPLAGRNINSADVKDADVLLVRSVTQVNSTLLSGSKVKFVGSATIGVDHIDLDYCRQAEIKVVSSPGCNADAVADYVLCALLQHDINPKQQRIAVIGLGNVGVRVARRLQALGAKVQGFDPFVQHDDIDNVSLPAALANNDIICMHVPNTKDVEHASYQMLNADMLALLKPNALLLNAGRGEVIDERALLARLQKAGDLRLMLDVWNDEPDINQQLLPHCLIATGHIAGYSLRGKFNGSQRVVLALYDFFNRTHPKALDVVPMKSLSKIADSDDLKQLKAASLKVYDIKQDDHNFRKAMSAKSALQLSRFDQYRKQYPVRDEFVQFRTTQALLLQAGFSL